MEAIDNPQHQRHDEFTEFYVNFAPKLVETDYINAEFTKLSKR